MMDGRLDVVHFSEETYKFSYVGFAFISIYLGVDLDTEIQHLVRLLATFLSDSWLYKQAHLDSLTDTLALNAV